MKTERGGFRMLSREQIFAELTHDSYRSAHKLAEPARCTKCGATYHHGRWTWEPASAGAQETLCPACHRINDDPIPSKI
jgi:hypothetical protein